MRRGACAPAALAAALMLTGCAAPRPPGAPGGDVLSGRIAISVDGDGIAPPRALAGAFELAGSARAGRLELTSPLGALVARARWTPERVVVETPQGETAHPSLDAAAREMLGDAIPVAALFDWLRGRPWPDAPAAASPAPAQGFRQLGWEVDLARLAEGVVAAARSAPAPAVRVRARLETAQP